MLHLYIVRTLACKSSKRSFTDHGAMTSAHSKRPGPTLFAQHRFRTAQIGNMAGKEKYGWAQGRAGR